MIAYITFYILLFFFSIQDFLHRNETDKKRLFLLLLSVIILFVGLRYKLANDWFNYLNLTKKIESLQSIISGKTDGFKSEISIEFGFKMLVSIINSFFDPESGQSLQALTFFVTVFSYNILFKVVKNDETIKYKFTFLVTYIGFTIFREFDILRQSISFYIFLLSIKYINVNWKKYLIYILVAFCFHTSSLIFLPLYFVLKSTFRKWQIILMLLLHILTMFIHFSFVSNLLELLSNYFPELVFVQKIYLYSSELEGGNSLSLVGVLYSIYLFLVLINYKDYISNNGSFKIYVNLFFIFILVNIFFSDSKDIADRFSYFFYFGLSFVFIASIDYFPKMIRLPYLLLVFIFPIVRFSRVISEPKTKSVLVPYRNYLTVQKSEEEIILANWQEKNEEGILQ